jgi:glycosyltransferase involved in cell wall biosynthesis
MQERIEQIIEDENLRKKLVAKGYARVKKYDWAKCAKQTFEIYNSIF